MLHFPTRKLTEQGRRWRSRVSSSSSRSWNRSRSEKEEVSDDDGDDQEYAVREIKNDVEAVPKVSNAFKSSADTDRMIYEAMVNVWPAELSNIHHVIAKTYLLANYPFPNHVGVDVTKRHLKNRIKKSLAVAIRKCTCPWYFWCPGTWILMSA